MTEGQSHLSEICTSICDQYEKSDLSNKEEESQFWDSFRKFHTELKNEKGGYNNLEKLIEKINEKVTIINSIKRDFQDNTHNELKEAARANLQSIMKKYAECINIVEQIKVEAELIENKTPSDNNLQWANLFLIRYYQIIAAEGCLEDSFSFLNHQLSAMDKEKIRGCFTSQKIRLTDIASVINFLKNLNGGIPEHLKQKVILLDGRIEELRLLYSQNMDLNVQVDKAFEVHKNLKEDILELYKNTVEETIKRG